MCPAGIAGPRCLCGKLSMPPPGKLAPSVRQSHSILPQYILLITRICCRHKSLFKVHSIHEYKEIIFVWWITREPSMEQLVCLVLPLRLCTRIPTRRSWPRLWVSLTDATLRPIIVHSRVPRSVLSQDEKSSKYVKVFYILDRPRICRLNEICHYSKSVRPFHYIQ